MHVHDNNGRTDTHLLPYFGTIDWEPFLDALYKIGYGGCFNLETVIGLKTPQPIKENMQRDLKDLVTYMAKRASGELSAPSSED